MLSMAIQDFSFYDINVYIPFLSNVFIAAFSYRCNFVKSVIIYIIARKAILIRAITS